MEKSSEEIIIAVITASLFIVLFGSMMVLVVVKYFRRKRTLLLERQMAEARYREEHLQAQLEIQESTFGTISQEIHDNVGQILSLAKIQLNIIGENEKTNFGLVAEAKENISKALTDLRDIAKGLNAEKITEVGLHATLDQEMQRINRSNILNIRQVIEGMKQEMDGRKKLILFRIIQESIQNIIKHAVATEVVICFHYELDFVKILISDNGNGFDVTEKKKATDGLGLLNMYNRATLINGKMTIVSSQGKGTIIELNIPYE